MSVNKVILIGFCGKAPEVRTVGDSKVATFTLATTEKFKGKDGNLKEETEWHNIVLWGKLADVAEKFIQKGTQVFIEGRIKTEKYSDQNGSDRYIVKIIASTLQLLGSKTESSSPVPGTSPATQTIKSSPLPPAGPASDSDLPF